MIYTINYYFNGHGKVKVKAKNIKKAEEKFFVGEWEGKEEETGEEYNIISVKEIKIK